MSPLCYMIIMLCVIISVERLHVATPVASVFPTATISMAAQILCAFSCLSVIIYVKQRPHIKIILPYGDLISDVTRNNYFAPQCDEASKKGDAKKNRSFDPAVYYILI